MFKIQPDLTPALSDPDESWWIQKQMCSRGEGVEQSVRRVGQL